MAFVEVALTICFGGVAFWAIRSDWWAVAPAVVAGSLTAVRLAREAGELRERLAANATLFRSLMTQAGFDLLPAATRSPR